MHDGPGAGGARTLSAPAPAPPAADAPPAGARRPAKARRGPAGVFLAALAVVALDRLTKLWVLQQLGPSAGTHHQSLVPGVLDLDFVQNGGAAFGLFPNASWPLAIIAGVVIVAILVLVPRLEVRPGGAPWHLLLALALVLGGAVGNLIDRLQQGYVIDFVTPVFARLTVGGTTYRFPTFNVADSAITVGVIVLLIGLWLLPADVIRDA